jgi:hypothetical protein
MKFDISFLNLYVTEKYKHNLREGRTRHHGVKHKYFLHIIGFMIIFTHFLVIIIILREHLYFIRHKNIYLICISVNS